MKKYLSLFVLLLMVSMYYSCKKGSKKDPDVTGEPEIVYDLDADGVAIWDNLESVKITPHDVILPDGQRLDAYRAANGNPSLLNKDRKKLEEVTKTLGPQAAKKELIANLTEAALYLTNDDNFIYADQGPNKPAQHGLAYSWGQRDYSVRQQPPGDGNKCPSAVYGLDCSGFLYNIFKRSGVIISDQNADLQRSPSGLEKAIKAAYPKLTKIKVEDLGKLPVAEMKTGDMIYWLEKDGKAHHIGMILNKDGENAIAQSNGSETSGCADNYGDRRGPRFSPIAKAILPKPKKKGEIGGYGDNYGIVRINTDLSGSWTFSLGCQGESRMLFDLDLTFPKDQNQFHTSKTATDYDGSTVTFNFDFTFDRDNAKMSCVYTMTDSDPADFERKDHFEIDLDKGDDSGPVNALNDYIHNGQGCSEVVRLVNNEKQGTEKKQTALFHTGTLQSVRSAGQR